MSRLAAFVVATSVSLAAAAVARPAHAEGVAYSYEVENVDAFPDQVLVVWPRACASSGEPLGTVDLKLNPDWKARMHDVDYEVVGRGGREVLDLCVRSSRFYVLPVNAFPRGTRISTGDDMAIGQPEAGATFTILPALDAVDLAKRIELFEKDPRVLRTSFRFDPDAAAKRGPPGTKAVHEVLSLGKLDGTSFTVEVKRVIYMSTDGGVSSAKAATADMPDATATDAGAADAGVAAAARTPGGEAPVDRGTRWVYAAAIGGLFMGGIIAAVRKKKQNKA